MMKKSRVIASMVFAIFAIYFITYLSLSVNGRYEPAVYGASGVKWYDWAPVGFVTDFRWNKLLIRVFFPLWHLDRNLWHTPQQWPNADYPFHEP